jgi:hypothetical protein
VIWIGKEEVKPVLISNLSKPGWAKEVIEQHTKKIKPATRTEYMGNKLVMIKALTH